MGNGLNSKYITADKLIDLMEYYINEYIQNSYWDDSFNATHLETILKDYASDYNYIIIDDEDFNWDSELHNIYDCTEKGLS